MNTPSIFRTDNLQIVQNNLKDLLNGCRDFENEHIIESPRSVGDAVQQVLAKKMASCFPDGIIRKFQGDFARRAMPDVAFEDADGNYFAVDIKTHNESTDFNMPNLTSVERLSRFYEDAGNYFVIVLAEYRPNGPGIAFDNVRFFPIEHLKWDCLTIGALGWGQVQIADARRVDIDRRQSRKDWMIELCNRLNAFYPKEIDKIKRRMDRFSQVRIFWNNRSDF